MTDKRSDIVPATVLGQSMSPESGRIVAETLSLCPDCFRRIKAVLVERDSRIYMEKVCPQHGLTSSLVWRGDAGSYTDWSHNAQPGCPPAAAMTNVDKGCPYDCGLCPSHVANACTMVMEVTSRCNLNCNVCFAGSRKEQQYEPDLKSVKAMYSRVLDTVGYCTVQLSGGEPTLRDDLPEIIAIGREMGFEHILVNSNGIRLATDSEFVRRLKDSGIGAVYLQFDGISGDIYTAIRGQNILDHKLRAIDLCAAEKIGVVLVPVLIPGINVHQIGEIFRFAKSRIPTVKGIHFQPISYLGRYPGIPADVDRITIPEVISALVQQTDGELRLQDFVPRSVNDSHCSFSSLFVLAGDGQLISLNNVGREDESPQGKRKPGPEQKARRFMALHWKYREGSCACESTQCCDRGGVTSDSGRGSGLREFERLQTHSLTISCMPFQDIWTVDLNRLKGCCGHVVTHDGHIVPFCTYNLTNTSGERLYKEG
jgi:uncharacterized radical SAM superfamily Fe-S cluster-containing enzyme